MPPVTLREHPSKNEEEWRFTVPPEVLLSPRNAKFTFIKSIKFTGKAISLQMERMPMNRILNGDDPSKFILCSFSELRFPESRLAETGDYITRLMTAGLILNEIQYRFYHHSNSQLRSRSCFLREAQTDEELDERIYRLGDFGRIMNVAKRAKRIGLLFSGAEIDWQLDPQLVTDIRDIKAGDELFSDGCGLISRKFAIMLSKAKRIIFRGIRYTPCVYQIRYLGYKGVLMLHPQLDKEKKYLVHFRDSMKKFTTTADRTFSVVGYSQPYAFGRLNNEIIVLLSSLGVSNDQLLGKQEAYFRWISEASRDVTHSIDFLSSIGKYDLAERVLLRGLDDPDISTAVRKLQLSEIASFRKNEKNRARMIIHKSRLLYGVCDPFRVLKEGQVHIRITASRKGPSTPIHGDVLVVRNPCLHPGDCLKLRAVDRPELSHLTDCIIFATVARPGHHAAPSMSSGGDLDGDKFFVCWDPDLVPSKVAESYDYPPNKEQVSRRITRLDLAKHFAVYNSAGLARVAALHSKWVRTSPKGALSSECQELNALHSQSVDGARIKIPDRLLTPPEPKEPYIIDLLADAASEFATRFLEHEAPRATLAMTGFAEAECLIIRLLQSQQNALSEYELFNLVLRLARKHSLDIYQYLKYLDFGALSTSEKYALLPALNPGPGRTPDTEPWMWNSLFRSDILSPEDLYQRNLNQPFSIQRLYTSKESSLATFFRFLHMATQDFTRKLLIMKTDDRFVVGVFMRGDIPWNEDPEVNENVVVCSFLPHGGSNLSTYRPCTRGYRLHCSDSNFQLYNKHRGDTFIFMTRPPAASGAEMAVSIALQKISAPVQRQLGRLNRAPVAAIELHVVSNRDRVAHQLFDLWFEHIPTEEFVRRFDREIVPYQLNNLDNVDWSKESQWLKEVFYPKPTFDEVNFLLQARNDLEIDHTFDFAVTYHAEDVIFWIFGYIISQLPLRQDAVIRCMNRHPPLVFALLKAYPPDDDALTLSTETAGLAIPILQTLIRSTNQLRIAVLVGFEKLTGTIAQLALRDYVELLMLASLSVRSQQLLQETLLVLNDCRASVIEQSTAMRYAHKHALAVAFDRAEEAYDECPCDEDGKPRRQRTAPTMTKLSLVVGHANQVKAAVRVDAKMAVRLHSHVRLQAASNPEYGWVEQCVVDGVVVQASKGELRIELNHPLPPEAERMDWKMYDAGSIATSRAMMDALSRLMEEADECCGFYSHLTGQAPAMSNGTEATDSPTVDGLFDGLNESQAKAVQVSNMPLSLIWGPPGTGKTTVVVQILRKYLQKTGLDTKILMTASTHNAVDNVLERFVEINRTHNILREDQILRVATDQSKVNKALQHYTIDARIGGDMSENSRLVRQAQQRVQSAIIIFTTCAGAGLGILRKVNFEVALIDEASQITEPCALIPLVKGIKQAVLVGDHVQLRPTVRRMAKALEYDISLLERLYTGPRLSSMTKTMLDVQYRFPRELADFPSREFYESRLKSAINNSKLVLDRLEGSQFPWPTHEGTIIPTVFIKCATEEDMGGSSKSNEGQVGLVEHIVKLLTTQMQTNQVKELTITVLSPYAKQVSALRHALPGSVPSYTIDSFQGRESDIIIFSTVRCNSEGDIGFVEDARRLNVMWTRARLALIIVGDQRTMSNNPLWKRAIDSCTHVDSSALGLPVTSLTGAPSR